MKQLIDMQGIRGSARSDNTLIIRWLGAISNIIIVCCLLFATNSAAVTPSGKYTKWQPGHYMRVSFNSTDVNDPKNRASLLASVRAQAKRPEFKGVLLAWYWNHIEPKKDRYDFSIVDEILAIMEDEDKYLMLRPMERVMSSRCELFPAYLDGLVDGEGIVRDGNRRCFTRIWERSVMDRWIKLNKEIAARYDNHPRVVAILNQETAITVSRTGDGGYTTSKYTNELVRFHSQVGPAFPHTIVFQSFNFLGGASPNKYFDEVIDSIRSHDTGGLTHPDTSPCKNGNYVNCDPENGLSGDMAPYFYERKYGSKGTNELAVMPQIQWGTWLEGLTADEFYGTAYDYLGANFFVWDARSTNFNSEFVPYFQSRNYEVVETCPIKLRPCYTGVNAPVTTQRLPAPKELTLSFD